MSGRDWKLPKALAEAFGKALAKELLESQPQGGHVRLRQKPEIRA